MKSKDLLDSFMAYCIDHPHERFWQALRNWSGYVFIWGERENGEQEDTFNKEEKY